MKQDILNTSNQFAERQFHPAFFSDADCVSLKSKTNNSLARSEVLWHGERCFASFLQCVTTPRGHALFRLASGCLVECFPYGTQWVVQRELTDADFDKLQD